MFVGDDFICWNGNIFTISIRIAGNYARACCLCAISGRFLDIVTVRWFDCINAIKLSDFYNSGERHEHLAYNLTT